MTMDCAAARTLLLEADPAELRGDGDSPLAAHLRDCTPCRVRAAAILAGEAELDTALRMIATPSADGKVIPLRPRRAVRLAPVAASLAALAAAVATVMIARPPAGVPNGATADDIARAMFPAPPIARAAAGKSVAVLKTSDPAVTVVWVY